MLIEHAYIYTYTVIGKNKKKIHAFLKLGYKKNNSFFYALICKTIQSKEGVVYFSHD